MKFFGLIFFLLSFTRATYAKTLSLTEAVQQALQQTPGYISALKTAEMGELQLKNIKAGYFPNLDLTTVHGLQGFDPKGQSPDTQSLLQLTLTESLYDNGERAKQQKISELTLRLNQIEIEKTKGKTILDIVQAFYQWNTSVLSLDFKRRYGEEVKKKSALATQLFHQGMKTQRDYLLFRTQARRSELDLSDAEKEVEKKLKALRLLVGLNPNGDDTFSLIHNPKKWVVDPHLPIHRLYEAQQMALKNEISEEQVALTRRKNWPEIALTAQAQTGSSNYLGTDAGVEQSFRDQQQNSWNALVSLKWNLLDWGTRTRNTQIEVLKQQIQNQTSRLDLLNAQRELEDFKIDWQQAEKNQLITNEIQQMEEKTFLIIDQDYRLGKLSSFDLVTGMGNLLDARSKKLQSDFDLSFLSLKAQYYEGTLNEKSVEF